MTSPDRAPSLLAKVLPGGVFTSLRHRNYRLLWFGTLVSHSGDWMDQIALNWLVLQTTGSALDLGLVNLFRGLPILLFTLIGGVAADRYERRRLLLVTQTMAMLVAFLLAALTWNGSESIGLILGIATLRGIIVSFNLPARHSLIPNLVPREDVGNAVALNSVTINLTKILGPLGAGFVIGVFGVTACFLVNGVSFLVVIGTLIAMRLPTEMRKSRPEPVLKSLKAGIAYVSDHPTIRGLVILALVPTFLGLPYVTLLALFAYQVYDSGPDGLGILTASAAFGSVLGGLLLAARPNVATSGRWMLIFLTAFGLLLALFAVNPVHAMAPVLLLLTGAAHISYNASNNTILQMVTEDEMRGRVLAILLVNRGLVQLGTAFLAAIASVTNPRIALCGAGLAIAAFGIGYLRRSGLSSLRP